MLFLLTKYVHFMMKLIPFLCKYFILCLCWQCLIDKGLITLYRSVVLNILNRPGEFIQTRDRKMVITLHIISEIQEASLVNFVTSFCCCGNIFYSRWAKFIYYFVDVWICFVFMVNCFIIRSIRNDILFLVRSCKALIPVIPETVNLIWVRRYLDRVSLTGRTWVLEAIRGRAGIRR